MNFRNVCSLLLQVHTTKENATVFDIRISKQHRITLLFIIIKLKLPLATTVKK